MFCRSAFLQASPPEGFRKLAIEVTKLAKERVIRMHHVLKKIGRDIIVLAPFIHQPAKRQLLIDSKEGCDVLIGTENVFGISIQSIRNGRDNE
ncbi:unnamed protein product [Arabis nemorensis]|uniref:Uncharacterized protein n=1 Tax=Arabis nemorensis TaxID=586526 RepID=A0A565CFX9_9BRAS|nr:unnamed protein product [Arabis nemorensis]